MCGRFTNAGYVRQGSELLRCRLLQSISRPGTGDLLFVKGPGDRSWRPTFRELFEDSANYSGFNLIDAAFATDALASGVDIVNNVIAEA